MRKGTFSVQTANPNSAKHNSRELAPKYLIDTSVKNYYELITPDNEFKNIAQTIYKQKIKQTMQKKQVENLIQETVLTLQPNQDEKDVKDLFKKLNQKYGGHELLEVAIHRDEGYFLKDDIAYYPTKNILNKNGDWYVCSDNSIKKPKQDDFDRIVNIDEFEKVYNYHAHAKFSMFDRETGKTARMQKKDMSERIKFVSDELGLLFAPDKETSRIKKSVNLVKDEHLARARELEKQKELKQDKKKLKEELEELKKENAKFREELKANEDLSTRENFKKQEVLNKQLQEDLKANKIELSEALAEIEKLKKDIFHPTLRKSDDTQAKYKEVANHYIKENKSLQEQNKSLQEQNEVLDSKVITLQSKINSSALQDDLLIKENKELKEKVTVLENENKSLKQKLKDIVNFANEKIKSLFQFKILNDYNLKKSRDWKTYINTERDDYWEEIVYYNSKEIDTLYKDNIENELIKIPGESVNYSKMNLQDILNLNKEDLKAFKKEATKELKEMLEEDKQETVVHTRKLF